MKPTECLIWGLYTDIKKVLALLPRHRQSLMFSATFSDDIRKLAKGLVEDPIEISVNPQHTTATTVTQWICPVDKKQKPALLIELIRQNKWERLLVFTKTKKGAKPAHQILSQRWAESGRYSRRQESGGEDKNPR